MLKESLVFAVHLLVSVGPVRRIEQLSLDFCLSAFGISQRVIAQPTLSSPG